QHPFPTRRSSDLKTEILNIPRAERSFVIHFYFSDITEAKAFTHGIILYHAEDRIPSSTRNAILELAQFNVGHVRIVFRRRNFIGIIEIEWDNNTMAFVEELAQLCVGGNIKKQIVCPITFTNTL